MGMNDGAFAQAQTWIARTLDRPETVDFAGGRVVVYTAAAPYKDAANGNEDCVAAIGTGPGGGVLVVADGVGGLPDAVTASALTVTTLAQALAVDDAANLRERILDAVQRANRELLEGGSGSGSTLAVVELQGRTVRTYHVGDSMVLVTGQRGRIKFQTVPHSPTGYAVESGLLDESHALHHADRHLVSNIIGSTDMRIEMGPELKLAELDTLVVASDGLWDNLYVDEVVETVQSGDLLQCAITLAERCHFRMAVADGSGPSHADDLSFLLYRPARQAPHPKAAS